MIHGLSICKEFVDSVNYKSTQHNRKWHTFLLVLTENNALEKGIKQPLLTSLKDKVDEDDDQDYEDSEEAPEDSHQPANSIGAAYRLLTPSVKVWEQL